MIKNTASQKVGVQMVSAADGSAFTGSVTVSVTGDAGTQATGSVGSGACTHEGNGYHTYAPAQAETNYDLVAFTFTGTGAVPQTVQVYTRAATPDVNVAQLSGDATAADNAESFFDGTGYAGTNNVIPTVTTLTNAPSDSSGVTTLLSRLSALRAGYLDNLSAGAVALESSLQALITTVGASAAGVASAVWSAGTRILTAGTNIVLAKGTGVTGFNDLSAAQVNAEADTAIADAALATAANLSTVAGYIDTEVAAIKAKTDNLPASPAATGDIPTAQQNADALLARDLGSGANAGSLNERTVRSALRFNRNKFTISGGTLTVYMEDDATVAFTAAITQTAGNPVSASDPT